jgi:hypothetical protein
MIYTRKNKTGSTVFWSESPDGSRILTLVPGHYSELGEVMGATGPLDDKTLEAVKRTFDNKQKITPEGLPILVLAGKGDYALAPAWRENPRQFLKQWRSSHPDIEVQFSTLSPYLNAVETAIRNGSLTVPTKRGGTEYDFNAFWVQNPQVKTAYRSCEHGLQAAEIAATVASLKSGFDYPDVPQHGPQHAMGRGRRHGLRTPDVVGCFGSFPLGSVRFEQNHPRLRVRALGHWRRRRSLQCAELEAQ